jgi:epoxyqueuosine reductase
MTFSAPSQKPLQDAGFDLAGIAGVGARRSWNIFRSGSRKGRAGEMKYLQARDEQGRLKRASLANVAPWARSVVVCAINYNTAQPYSTEVSRMDRGWISRYAWSEDYHESVMDDFGRSKLREGCSRRDNDVVTCCYVDTGPIVERVVAKYAGIGWIGKNTCIINQKMGSWLFLGVILTSLELAAETARARSLRQLHALHRRLPDRRARRAPSTRFQQMHRLSHD